NLDDTCASAAESHISHRWHAAGAIKLYVTLERRPGCIAPQPGVAGYLQYLLQVLGLRWRRADKLCGGRQPARMQSRLHGSLYQACSKHRERKLPLVRGRQYGCKPIDGRGKFSLEHARQCGVLYRGSM